MKIHMYTGTKMKKNKQTAKRTEEFSTEIIL